MDLALMFLAGLFMGATLGFFACALLATGREPDDHPALRRIK